METCTESYPKRPGRTLRSIVTVSAFAIASYICLGLCMSSSRADDEFKIPDPAEATRRGLEVTRKIYPHGKVSIEILQVKKVGDNTASNSGDPRICRAEIIVKKGKWVLKEISYDDIDAVGSHYGLFIPRNTTSIPRSTKTAPAIRRIHQRTRNHDAGIPLLDAHLLSPRWGFRSLANRKPGVPLAHP